MLYEHWFLSDIFYRLPATVLVIISTVLILYVFIEKEPVDYFFGEYVPAKRKLRRFGIPALLYIICIFVSIRLSLTANEIRSELSCGEFIIFTGSEKFLTDKFDANIANKTVTINNMVSYSGHYKYIYDIATKTKLSDLEIAAKMRYIQNKEKRK